MPPPLRKPVAAIYWFARTADDFSDEGDLAPEQRITLLQNYQSELDRIEGHEPSDNPIFQRLAPVIAEYKLPLQLFRDLLDAFIQDVSKDRYADCCELLDYCRRSADPVGRLMLHLFNAATEENLRQSDAVCSALQLINHWQDVAVDMQKNKDGRIYLPQDDLARFQVSETQLQQGLCDDNFRALMKFQVDRARALMLSGAPLGRRLPGRVGIEIRAIIAGGLRILAKIEAVDYDVFRQRPKLTAFDWPFILFKAL